MARQGVSLTPVLNTQQLAAVVNEVAASSPIAREAVAQACERQSDGLVRTRSATLYATGQITAGPAAPGIFAAGTSVDLFTVPVGQVGSGFPAATPLTKAQTSMQTAGLLASEAFQVQKMGMKVAVSTDTVHTAEQVTELLDFFNNNITIELALGGQDVQLLGLLGQWPDLAPEYTGGLGAGGIASSGTQVGMASNGYESVVPLDLFIPQQVPFKVSLRIQTTSAFALPTPFGATYDIRCTFYGVSVTAIQA